MNSATMEQASSKHCTLAVLGFQSCEEGNDHTKMVRSGVKQRSLGHLQARNSCLELGVVCESRQREEQTQFAVVIFRWAEFLQGMETLHCLLHGELQLKKKKRHIFCLKNKVFYTKA